MMRNAFIGLRHELQERVDQTQVGDEGVIPI